MSLIDESYFTGYLSIPQLGQASVVENLNYFITREEPIFLQACLGYALWQDFIAGLAVDPIDPKWLNLRDGVDFTPDGLWPPFQWKNMWMNFNRDWYIPQRPVRKMHWVGFTGGTTDNGPNNSFGPILLVIAGQTTNVTLGNQTVQIVGPTPGTNTYTNSLLAGLSYYIERRGYGTMTSADVSIINNGQTITLLKNGDVFNNGEVFILHFINQAPSSGAPSIAYPSPIAGHVYYKYFRDQAANLSAFGVVSTDGENSVRSNGMLKMTDAFNRASDDILKLWQFIDYTSRKDATVYPSYDRLAIDYEYFKPINHFGI